jgi:diacylglycerol kinase family enzyme
VTKVAVIAHAGKSFGGGLRELRQELERQGVDDPLWVEVAKSKFAPKQVARVLDEGAELIFVWGGDGMLQRSIDALAGSETPLAILPAATANPCSRPTSAFLGTSSRRCRSVSTGSGAGSMWGGSTASASRSWPGRDSTRR